MNKLNESDIIEITELLQTATENVEKVYNSGCKAGNSAVYDIAYAEGAVSEQERFWKIFQAKGARTSYEYSFSGEGWTDETFLPRYDMIPTTVSSMFYRARIGDLVSKLEEAGIVLDTSNASSFNYAFASSRIKRLGVIDMRASTQANYTFAYMTLLETIEKIVLKDDGSMSHSNWFPNCHVLKNVTFEGVIGKNLNMQWSTELSFSSIENIINTLSESAEGMTLTLSKAAVDIAFGGSYGDPAEWVNGSELSSWLSLAATKPNWTITLI